MPSRIEVGGATARSNRALARHRASVAEREREGAEPLPFFRIFHHAREREGAEPLPFSSSVSFIMRAREKEAIEALAVCLYHEREGAEPRHECERGPSLQRERGRQQSTDGNDFLTVFRANSLKTVRPLSRETERPPAVYGRLNLVIRWRST